MEVTNELNMHIIDKITYHKKLLAYHEGLEDYLECVKHRDEITRLSLMIDDFVE